MITASRAKELNKDYESREAERVAEELERVSGIITREAINGGKCVDVSVKAELQQKIESALQSGGFVISLRDRNCFKISWA